MIDRMTSKRTSVLMALLILGMALMAVSANSAYATHGGGPLYETDFPNGAGNDVNNLTGSEWTDGDGGDGDCRIANVHAGEMALQVRNTCGAFVTFDPMGHDKLLVEYDRGHHTTAGSHRGSPPTNHHGELVVQWRVTGLVTWNDITFHQLPHSDKQLPTIPESHPFNVGAATSVDIRFLGATNNDNDRAWVDDLVVIQDLTDFLPDGTITYTQGYYGQSPGGEQDTCDIITALFASGGFAEPTLDEILDVLDSPSVDVDISSFVTAQDLCDFLVGEVGTDGGNNDGGFLPAGKVDGRPKSNLAAQKITLLLNLNLDVLFGAPANPGDPIPILRTYQINIDPVQDVVGGVADRWFDPVLITDLAGDLDEKLGDCTDGAVAPPNVCDAAPVLTLLGMKVLALDIAGTTVEDMEDAACTLLDTVDATDATEIDVNGVTLTQIDVINILSLIAKSYDEGVPNGFVTDGDPGPN